MPKGTKESRARVIAFYLPQFHPVEVNDTYWGKGFTEWTNVAKAKPLFRGHEQPQIPADLGFYDLRVPQVRQAQADMAREAGIEGFCYWNYWFGRGKKVLEMPIEELMRTHEPDFPFCVGWANHDWSNKTWQKTGRFTRDLVFLKQEYLGEEDYRAYFEYLLPCFLDERYIRVDGKPLFYLYDPYALPDARAFMDCWRALAVKNGLPGMHFVCRADAIDHIRVGRKQELLAQAGQRYQALTDMGFDALDAFTYRRAELIAGGMRLKILRGLQKKLTGHAPAKYDYLSVMKHVYIPETKQPHVYPHLLPRKDRTPRSGRDAQLYTGSTPQSFRECVRMALECVKDKPEQQRIIFLDSWNEWGEGSYMEPDLRYGHGYLDALRDELQREE